MDLEEGFPYHQASARFFSPVKTISQACIHLEKDSHSYVCFHHELRHLFIHSFIHKYVMSVSYVPGTVHGLGNKSEQDEFSFYPIKKFPIITL